MIIEQSVISMSSEHQKSESVSFFQQSELSGFGRQFVEARSLLGEEQPLKNISSGDALKVDQQGDAFLMMTENGLQFKPVEGGRSAEVQQSVTQAGLFKALFEAITGTELPVEESNLLMSGDAIEGFSGERVQRSLATDFLSEVKTVKLTVSLSHLVEEHEITRFSAGGTVKPRTV